MNLLALDLVYHDMAFPKNWKIRQYIITAISLRSLPAKSFLSVLQAPTISFTSKIARENPSATLR